MTTKMANRLADAIFRQENSVKFPYGIKSIPTHSDKVYARRICLNTINHQYRNYVKAGSKGDFIDYLCDVGHYTTTEQTEWKHNVKYFYARAK